MPNKILITQSNYIPWKGYFDVLNSVDIWVIYDQMQFTRRDWRNRNLIKTPSGTQWLSIPVEIKGKYFQKICETQVFDLSWNRKHWSSLQHNYSRASYFKEYKDVFENLYLGCSETFLSEINLKFIQTINKILNIQTQIITWQDYQLQSEEKTERLIELCKKYDASDYFTGPAAQAYINIELFNQEKIQLHYLDYSGYKPYNQLYGEFVHGVSIVDLLFNEGPNAKNFMKSFQ